MSRGIIENYKSQLFELAASHFGIEQPQYFAVEYGPAHAKVFLCICSFHRKTTLGEGRTKVESEQLSSKNMLDLLHTHSFESDHRAAKETTATLSSETTALAETLRSDTRFDILSLYGDSILRYHIARYLFDHYQGFKEGILTRIVSQALREETRAEVAHDLGFERYVRTVATPRVLAETLSAFIGKLAESLSEEAVKDFVISYYKSFIDLSAIDILKSQLLADGSAAVCTLATTIHNFKGELLTYAQRHQIEQADFSIINGAGLDHDKTFTVICHFMDFESTGLGKTRIAAEQDASQEMLTLLRQADAASTRIVSESSFSASHQSRFKIFKSAELKEFKSIINWRHFDNLDRLHEAFTHPSQSQSTNYQRLEFLGDALLKKMLLQYILKTYPEIIDKAFLSPKIDQLISRETQNHIANNFGLTNFIYKTRETLLSEDTAGDVLEALVAVIQLDDENQIEYPDRRRREANHAITFWFRHDIKKLFGAKVVPIQAIASASVWHSRATHEPDFQSKRPRGKVSCRFFTGKQDSCRHGSSCKFSHGK